MNAGWIIDRLPEDNRLILVYDFMSGVHLGYFAISSFYDLEGDVLQNVSAWMSIPDKPKVFTRIIDKVRYSNFVNVQKKPKGDTEDV